MASQTTQYKAYNISIASRAVRAIVGLGLLVETMSINQYSLSTSVVLAMLTAYSTFTAVVGWDFMKDLYQK